MPFELSIPDADGLFLQRLRDAMNLFRRGIASGGTTGTQITDEMRSLRSKSLAGRKNAYDSQRLLDQYSWYSKRSDEHRRATIAWNVTLLIAQVLSGVCLLLLPTIGEIRLAIPVVGSAAAAVTAWLQTKQFDSTSRAYALAAQSSPQSERSCQAFPMRALGRCLWMTRKKPSRVSTLPGGRVEAALSGGAMVRLILCRFDDHRAHEPGGPPSSGTSRAGSAAAAGRAAVDALVAAAVADHDRAAVGARRRIRRVEDHRRLTDIQPLRPILRMPVLRNDLQPIHQPIRLGLFAADRRAPRPPRCLALSPDLG